MSARKSRRLAVLLIMSLVITGATYAFAAANTVAASDAGDGSGVVSGYNVTAIRYGLMVGDADPTTVDEVNFTLDKAADEVFVKYTTDAAYYACVEVAPLGAPFDFTCATPASTQTVLLLTDLRVISAN